MKPLKSSGVFAVSRAIFDDPDFANEPFTQREAFMWLVANAAWKEHKTRGTRGVIDLKRGEFCFAIRFLAERWQWSKSRVERFISVLKNRDTIRDASRDGEQVYFISKYNDFQVIGMPKRDSDRDTKRDKSGTAAGQERDKEETLEHLNIVSSSLRSEEKPRDALSILSDVLDLDRSKAVLQHRRSKKLAVTDYAISLLVTSLKACPDPNLAADEMILRGWSSVKPEWLDRDRPKQQAPPRKSAHVERHDEARRILEESILARRQSKNEHADNAITIDHDDDWSPFGTIIGGRQ